MFIIIGTGGNATGYGATFFATCPSDSFCTGGVTRRTACLTGTFQNYIQPDKASRSGPSLHANQDEPEYVFGNKNATNDIDYQILER